MSLGAGPLVQRATRWAWVPVVVLALVIAGLRIFEAPAAYPWPRLQLAIQLTFAAGASAVIAFLMARSFLARGSLGQLLLGCGVIAWGAAGVTANAVGPGQPNVTVTIHNLCVWLSAVCHLLGVAMASRPPLAARVPWLIGGYAGTLLAVALVAAAAQAQWLPVFFVQGQGGTPVRQFVLITAVAQFLAAAAAIGWWQREQEAAQGTAYRRWYALGLTLAALGLAAVALQIVNPSLLTWAGIATQCLGTLYLLMAALLSTRERRLWQLPFSAGPRDARLRYALAVLFVGAAVVVRLVFFQGLRGESPHALLYPAVILAALYGGWGPGALAIGLSSLAANLLWLDPTIELQLGGWRFGVAGVSTTLFLINAGAMVALVLLMQQARERSRDAVQAGAMDELRARHAQAARETSERLNLAMTAAEMGSWEWDIASDRVIWGAQTRAICGVAPGTTITTALIDSLLHPDDRAANREAHREALRSGRYRVDLRIIRPDDGSQRWIASRGHLLRDAQGRAQRLLGVVMDVTERARAEQLLREADQRKDEFLATLAHELRNPLAPVRNAVQVLQMNRAAMRALQPELQAELQWAARVIERQVQQLTRLIDDLMDVSRVSQGLIELRRGRVALSDVVQAAHETSRPVIEHAHQELEIELPTEPVWLDADATRLAQVFSNLLNNASKYSDNGTHIALRAKVLGDHVEITVADRGIGIPSRMLERIFEMFEQVDHSLERTRGGLGIGLSLVKRLVELHGGSVQARSAGLGLGSELVVRLPVLQNVHDASAPLSAPSAASTAASTAASSAAPAAAVPAAAGPGRRILIADDNRDASHTLALLLSTLGHHVRIANDGLQAVQEAASFEPDIVLLDIGMPGLNGYDAARAIRAQDANASAVLIATTGWGQDEDRRRSTDAGFDHHLVKPVDLDELMRLIAGLPK